MTTYPYQVDPATEELEQEVESEQVAIHTRIEDLLDEVEAARGASGVLDGAAIDAEWRGLLGRSMALDRIQEQLWEQRHLLYVEWLKDGDA